MQPFQDDDERFVIRTDFDPQDLLGSYVDAHLLEHDVHQVFAFFLGGVFPFLSQIEDGDNVIPNGIVKTPAILSYLSFN